MRRATIVRLTAAVMIGALASAPAVAGDARNVEIVVNAQLYGSGELSGALDRYLSDIRRQGYTPILTTTPFADAAALRSHLAGRYRDEGLAGALLIGDLPAPAFEIDEHGSWEYERFPADLYYQDLDGTWADANGNGVLDAHGGNVAPEIWLGRLATHTLTGLHAGRTEAGLLNEYFARNHAYRSGLLSVAETGLAYVDDDWRTWASSWGNELRVAVAGPVTIVSEPSVTTAEDYKARLAEEHEHLLLCVHSTATRHEFEVGGEEAGSFESGDVAAVGPEALFYNLFACSNADYTTEGYLAGEYVFGSDVGLLAVGSSKVGSMLSLGDYFGPLGAGEPFGEAWLSWWEARAVHGFNVTERDWHYGMTMIGDPLLTRQRFLPIPEPATLGLLAALGAVLLRRRRR